MKIGDAPQVQGPGTGVKFLAVLRSCMIRHRISDNITVKVLQQTVPVNVKVLEAFGELLE